MDFECMMFLGFRVGGGGERKGRKAGSREQGVVDFEALSAGQVGIELGWWQRRQAKHWYEITI